jgi:16S rRNA (uracil1498-N3)-methyltransferase
MDFFHCMLTSLAPDPEIWPNSAMICRLYLKQALQVGSPVALPSDQAHYLRQVMRLQTGDAVVLFNGQGGEYSGHIEQLSQTCARCMVDSFSEISRELHCRLHIVQATCRSEKIEGVLQKGTELGAAGFHIVHSERSSLRLSGNRLEKRLDRWRKIIIEATEQSGRTQVPELVWHDSLLSLSGSGFAIVLHPHATKAWGKVKPELTTASDITMAIGPEGGWSSRDIDKLKALHFQPITFGTRILRTETAAPALLAAIQAIRND